MKKQKILTGILSVVLFGNHLISSSYIAFAVENESETVENKTGLEQESSVIGETEDMTTDLELATERKDAPEVAPYQEQASIPVDAKISEIFPDPNMAQAVAELFGKTVTDSLTELERNRTVISLLSKNIESIEGISVFSKLVNLKLGGNKIKSYPKELNQLPDLNVLWLNNNEIASLEGFGEVAFPALTQLYLADNQISELPETFVNYSIGKGTGSEIYLDNNQLTQLPTNIGTVEKMRTFTASGNFLSEIPASLLENSTVSAMDLSNNQLVKLPDTIVLGSNLTTLYLSGNQLTSLPASFGHLAKIRDLELSNNLLPTFYPETLNALLTSLVVKYEAQDKLELIEPNIEVTVKTKEELAELPLATMVKLASSRSLNDHHYLLDDFQDEEGNSVDIDHYFNSKSIEADQVVYAKVRAAGEGLFPDTSDNALTDDRIKINIRQPEPSKEMIEAKDSVLYVGDQWKPEDNFVAAKDKEGNSLPFNESMVSGTVDTNKAGEYFITYTNGEASQKITVTVKEKTIAPGTDPSDKSNGKNSNNLSSSQQSNESLPKTGETIFSPLYGLFPILGVFFIYVYKYRRKRS